MANGGKCMHVFHAPCFLLLIAVINPYSPFLNSNDSWIHTQIQTHMCVHAIGNYVKTASYVGLKWVGWPGQSVSLSMGLIYKLNDLDVTHIFNSMYFRKQCWYPVSEWTLNGPGECTELSLVWNQFAITITQAVLVIIVIISSYIALLW